MNAASGDALYRNQEGRLLVVKRLVNNDKHQPQWLIIDPDTQKNLLLPDPKSYLSMLKIWESNGWDQVIEVPWTSRVMLVPIDLQSIGNKAVRFIERKEL